jgi:hypothetical protein
MRHRERSKPELDAECACGHKGELGSEEYNDHVRTCPKAAGTAYANLAETAIAAGGRPVKPGIAKVLGHLRGGELNDAGDALVVMMPRLGDPAKVYTVQLTEPEINSLYAAIGWLRGQTRATEMMVASGMPGADAAARLLVSWWNNYGPTLEALDEKLKQFDDGDAPRGRR